MKVLPINNNYDLKNTNFKAANKFCKYSINTLIASSSLFMLSTALDTYKPEKTEIITSAINPIASVLTLAGTAMGLFGIEKIKHND